MYIYGFFKYRYSNNETRANKKKRKGKIHFEVIHVIPFSLYSAIISSNDCVQDACCESQCPMNRKCIFVVHLTAACTDIFRPLTGLYDYCYWMITTLQNSTDSSQLCAKDGGTLAWVNSAEAQAFVEKTFAGTLYV